MASSFLAGFAQGATRAIEEKRSFIRDTVERRREELRQQGYDRLNQTRQMRQGFQQAADILLSAGMTQENVVALLEDNPNMFNLVAANVGQLAMAGEPPQNINNLVRFANNARPSGTSLAEAINNAVPGIIRANEGVTDPARRERNSLAAMLGLSTEDALQRYVYNEELVQGFTGADIAASANAELVAPSRGQVQIDYTALRGEEELDPRVARDLIGDLATGYANEITNDITELNGLAAMVPDLQNESLQGEERDNFLSRLSAYGITVTDPEEIMTQIQNGIAAREDVLEESPAYLVQSAIEDLRMSDERLREMAGVNSGILSPLYFPSSFIERYTGTEPQTETETVKGVVTEEAAAQTEEVFAPEPVEPAIETAEQAAGIITQALPALEQLPGNFREQVYVEGAGGAFPTPAFQTWLQENSSEEEFIADPETAVRSFIVDTGVVPVEEVLDLEFETLLQDISTEEGAQKIVSSTNFSEFTEYLKETLGRDISRNEAFELFRRAIEQSSGSTVPAPFGGGFGQEFDPRKLTAALVGNQDLLSKFFSGNDFIALYEAIQ